MAATVPSNNALSKNEGRGGVSQSTHKAMHKRELEKKVYDCPVSHAVMLADRYSYIVPLVGCRELTSRKGILWRAFTLDMSAQARSSGARQRRQGTKAPSAGVESTVRMNWALPRGLGIHQETINSRKAF